jgi:hypothetical protein
VGIASCANEMHTLTTTTRRHIRVIDADVDGAICCRNESSILSSGLVDKLNEAMSRIGDLSRVNEPREQINTECIFSMYMMA